MTTKEKKTEWPKWQKWESAWWFTFIGAICGLVLLVFPSLIDAPLWIRLIVVIGMVLLPLVISSVRYLFQISSVILSRVHNYSNLYTMFEQSSRVILSLMKQLIAIRGFEIDRVSNYNHDLYITFKKKKGITLQQGDLVSVIDTREGIIMGSFQITEIRENEYRAKNSGYIDPVWRGYIYQAGKAESVPPPDTIAIHLPQNGE
jgi:hypothetical protein